MNLTPTIKQFRQSPIKFVKVVWDLEPQPIKPEWKNEVDIFVANGLWNRVEAKHFETFIKGKHITWQQWIILKAVERGLIGQGSKKITIVSGHGIGKDACISWLIPWFLLCWIDAVVAATAPTSEQIHDILWKEIKIWKDRMPKELGDLLDWQGGYLRHKESPETWFARARTARKENPEAIAGLHGDHVFIVSDEASGVDDAIYRSAEGSLTGPNTLVILIGNGVRNLGYFYETHNDEKEKQNWQVLSFNSEDSPIVSRAQIARWEDKYGRDSDEFKIRVLGQFPSSEQMDETGFIPLITDRDIRQVSDGIPFVGRTYLGIDPAGEGDDLCTFTLRDRFQARVVEKLSSSNDKQIAKVAYDIIQQNNIAPQDVTVFNFGYRACSHLLNTSEHLE